MHFPKTIFFFFLIFKFFDILDGQSYYPCFVFASFTLEKASFLVEQVYKEAIRRTGEWYRAMRESNLTRLSSSSSSSSLSAENERTQSEIWPDILKWRAVERLAVMEAIAKGLPFSENTLKYDQHASEESVVVESGKEEIDEESKRDSEAEKDKRESTPSVDDEYERRCGHLSALLQVPCRMMTFNSFLAIIIPTILIVYIAFMVLWWKSQAGNDPPHPRYRAEKEFWRS